MRPQNRKATVLSTFSMACLALVLAASGLQAEVLLIDPSTVSGTTTFATANVPYSVSTASVWNRSNTGNYATSGTLYYSSGTAATGVTAVTDALENLVLGSGTAVYNFSAPAVSTSAGNVLTGVFATNPSNTGVVGTSASNVGYGGLATKVSGLAFGTYEIYVVTGYTGATPASRPGAGSAAQHNVWAFEGGNFTTLQAGTYGAPDTLLENSTTASWVLNDNYAMITVTLDATNPYLYVISQGALNDSNRGWLDSIQIVAVPEPSYVVLLALSTSALFFRRRRSCLHNFPR